MKTLTKNLTLSDIVCLTIVTGFSYLFMAFMKIPILKLFSKAFDFEYFSSFDNAIIPCGVIFLLLLYYAFRQVIHLFLVLVQKYILKQQNQNTDSKVILDSSVPTQNEILTEKQLRFKKNLDNTIRYAISTICKYVKLSESDISNIKSNIYALVKDNPLEEEIIAIETNNNSILRNTNLVTTDLFHYGWNIWKILLSKEIKQEQIAIFLKLTFPNSLKDSEIETIKRKLKSTEFPSTIRLIDKNNTTSHH